MRQLNLISMVFILLMTAACGAVHPQMTLTKFGVADPLLERQIREDFDRMSKAQTAVDKEEVTVLVETFPEGLVIEEGTLRVLEGFSHEVIARFRLVPDRGIFVDYKDPWRKFVCYPQDVLIIATLGVWAIIPTSYPCFAEANPDKVAWLEDVRRATKAAGGDMAIISFMDSPNSDEAWGISGYIIQSDKKAKLKGDSSGLPPKDSP